MKKLYVFVCLCFISNQVLASNGFFNTKYTTKSGIEWSQDLGIKLSNGCKDPLRDDFGPPYYPDAKYCTVANPQTSSSYWDVQVADSKAAKACGDIGGRLPTLWDYIELLKEFEHHYYGAGILVGNESEPTLTLKGTVDFIKIFDDTQFDFYWTSSIRRHHFGPQMGLIVGFGKTLDTGAPYEGMSEENRAVKYSVRCVK